MRILVINWRDIKHPEAGGAEVHFHETFTRIAARGHEVTLLCSHFKGAPEKEIVDGINIVRSGAKLTFNLSVPWIYKRRFARSSFDMIVEDLNKIPFFLPLLVKDRPILALVHHLFGAAVFRETNPVFASYVYLTERLIPLIYRSCRFEVVSESTGEELETMGIPGDQIDVVHNGIDIDLYRSEPPATDARGTSIIYLGRLKRYKNVDRLIHAFNAVRKQVPGARLTIVGEGDHRPELESLAQRLDLSGDITFTGFVSDEEKVGLLRSADVAAFPSDKEGWGLSVIEANACFTPVVATRVPGLQDAVIDGETGILVPLGDTGGLARELTALLTDHERRARMATVAARRAMTFTWSNTADRTLKILKEVGRVDT